MASNAKLRRPPANSSISSDRANHQGLKTRVVILGAGIGCRSLIKHLNGDRDIEVTVIQPNTFQEYPFSGPLSLAYPDVHHKFITESPIPADRATTIYGVPKGVVNGNSNDRALVVQLAGSTATYNSTANQEGGRMLQEVPFDYLVAASGFSLPTLQPRAGMTLEERRAEVNAVRNACESGACVVVGGGGVIAVEVAGNLAQVVNAHNLATLTKEERGSGGGFGPGFGGRVVLVSSSACLVPGYAPATQQEVTKQLEALGVEVLLGARVTSHSSTAFATPPSSSSSSFSPSPPPLPPNGSAVGGDGGEDVPKSRTLLDLTLSSSSSSSPPNNNGEERTLSGVALYLPAFVGAANTEWLTSLPSAAAGAGGAGGGDGGNGLKSSTGNGDRLLAPPLLLPGGGGGGGGSGVVDAKTKQIVLDEFMRCTAFPWLFALGGCAKLHTKESFLGVVKIEEQAKTVALNLRASMKGTELIAHREALPSLTNAPAIIVGHHTFAVLATEVLPLPTLTRLACLACGPPCNVLLCPCFGVAVGLGLGHTGLCGRACGGEPQGIGTAQCCWKLFLSGLPAWKSGYTGMGHLPPSPSPMDRR